MKYLKIFDRLHNTLDEVDCQSALKYTWTLNGMGKAEFDIPLESKKNTPENFQFHNHIEIMDGSNKLWGGQIVDRNFQGSKLHIGCFGYLSLLKWRRLRAKIYTEMDYGSLLQAMLSDTNVIEDTGVSIGSIASGALHTQRKVEDKDYLLDKMQEFIQDCNNDIDVDSDRLFNFYLHKGTDKPYYTLEYGGDADNIIKDPGLSQTIQDMANSIYSSVETDGTTLTATAQDNTSINEFGFMEGSYDANSGIVMQSTLDNYTQGELQRRAYPANSLSLKVKDSSLCPFSDIEVGDSVTVHLIPYWNFTDVLRILEMTHNEDDGTRDITVGQTLYRPQPPVKKLYRK